MKSQFNNLVKEVHIYEDNSLKSRIGHMEKEIQNLSEENSSLKIRMEQIETNDFMRNQEIMKQNQENEKIEDCEISHWKSN